MKSDNAKVIINADDFGITAGVNKAILELANAGRVTSTSVMSNMAGYEEIVQLKGKIGIGLHFNLTAGRPVTEPLKIPTLVNDNGEFFKLQKLLKNAKMGKVSREDVETEFKAQIKRLVDIGITPDHVNSHESILKYPFFVRDVKKITKQYGIEALRTFSQRQFDYTRLLSPGKIMRSIYLSFQKVTLRLNGYHVVNRHDSLLVMGLDYEMACDKLRNVFMDLSDGVLEFVVHPGYCNGNHQNLGRYVLEREAELKALLSDEFADILEHSGVRLIAFSGICDEVAGRDAGSQK